jgi:hypothetical protein
MEADQSLHGFIDLQELGNLAVRNRCLHLVRGELKAATELYGGDLYRLLIKRYWEAETFVAVSHLSTFAFAKSPCENYIVPDENLHAGIDAANFSLYSAAIHVASTHN